MAETATWKRGRDPLPNNAADISAESHQRFYNNGERILPSYSVDFPGLHPISSEWSARCTFWATNWNRTNNLLITSELLCQLSYSSKPRTAPPVFQFTVQRYYNFGIFPKVCNVLCEKLPSRHFLAEIISANIPPRETQYPSNCCWGNPSYTEVLQKNILPLPPVRYCSAPEQ